MWRQPVGMHLQAAVMTADSFLWCNHTAASFCQALSKRAALFTGVCSIRVNALPVSQATTWCSYSVNSFSPHLTQSFVSFCRLFSSISFAIGGIWLFSYCLITLMSLYWCCCCWFELVLINGIIWGENQMVLDSPRASTHRGAPLSTTYLWGLSPSVCPPIGGVLWHISWHSNN